MSKIENKEEKPKVEFADLARLLASILSGEKPVRIRVLVGKAEDIAISLGCVEK